MRGVQAARRLERSYLAGGMVQYEALYLTGVLGGLLLTTA